MNEALGRYSVAFFCPGGGMEGVRGYGVVGIVTLGNVVNIPGRSGAHSLVWSMLSQ